MAAADLAREPGVPCLDFTPDPVICPIGARFDFHLGDFHTTAEDLVIHSYCRTSCP